MIKLCVAIHGQIQYKANYTSAASASLADRDAHNRAHAKLWPIETFDKATYKLLMRATIFKVRG